MKIKGVKRGQIIELLEEIDLADGEEITLEISDAHLNSQKRGFGEGLLKFRQVHNLEAKGIEPEDWLQDVQDRTPGQEIIW